MKTTSLIFFGAIIAVSAVTAFAAEPVGTIVSFSGKATATAQNGEIRNLELKAPVFLNDRIKTDTASSLQIMFLDDSVLSQGEKSEMTIDEYVYSPKIKGDNKCTLSLTKGVFRAVTARITSLNPDRFKVKTRLATIGIRGCELAFTVSQTSENIYVLSLPDGKSISITIDPVAAAGMNLTGVVNKEAAIEILQAGTMISIQEGEGVTQRFITNQEAVDLIEQLSNPDDSGTPPPPPGDNTGPGSVIIPDDIQPPPAPPPPPENIPESTTTTTTTPTVTTTTQPPAPTLVYTTMGTGTDWEWGVWALPAQPPQSVDFIGRTILPDTDVGSLVSGTPHPNLSGVGAMAAIINRAGISYFVNGSCSVLVNIGTSTANNWSINGSATDGTAFLGCMIRGSITGGGILQPDVIGSADYNLSGVGASYNGLDINTQSVNANLTGTGSINPPTGIIGHFNITHDGGATTVQGGFGSNL